MPLGTVTIDNAITNRPYQHEAVRRVSDAFEAGQRRALLVMATGTGKTRTAMSLVNVFMRADQARRVLFVADRDSLVEQALTEGFKDHLPDEPATRIYSGELSKESRLFVVTLQTLNNIFREFTPAFSDLIIFDEVHHSIFNRWNEVVKYFDARMIGLTATPAPYLDRNTFVEFGCPDNVPTFHYSYKEAVDEGHLADYRLYSAQTKFQRTGIKGADLSEEDRNALIEQGIDPDDLDLSGSELERTASNKDTLRQQWQEIWDVCKKDPLGLPGKTIVFAMTEDHALRLEEAFKDVFPQYPGLARVITYRSEYKGTLIKTFKKESLPRIAISVDMLETGVNVPEVVNLVFMRPVQSPIKIAQMIGRGTRNQEACEHPEWLPEEGKKDFLVIDFWKNTFGSLPVMVSLFNTRVKKEHLSDQGSGDAERLKTSLREMIGRIPTNSLNVEQAYQKVKHAWDDFWRYLTAHKLDFLRAKVAPLLRFAAEVDIAKETFTHKVERLKLQRLRGKDVGEVAASIAEDVGRLPSFVTDDAANTQAVNTALSYDLSNADPAALDEATERLAPLLNKRRDKESIFLELFFSVLQPFLLCYSVRQKAGVLMIEPSYNQQRSTPYSIRGAHLAYSQHYSKGLPPSYRDL